MPIVSTFVSKLFYRIRYCKTALHAFSENAEIQPYLFIRIFPIVTINFIVIRSIIGIEPIYKKSRRDQLVG